MRASGPSDLRDEEARAPVESDAGRGPQALVSDFADRGGERPAGSGRAAWIVFGFLSAISAALLLWLNRGGTLYLDELRWFSDLGRLSGPDLILSPHNGHLHGTTRTLYLLMGETTGFNYTILRVLGVVGVVLCAGAFFALAKRRIGAWPALAPAVVLLLYGSAWQHVVVPIGFTITFSLAAGLTTLLCMERDDRRGDVLACTALCISVFTFTIGLGFIVGTAILVLLRSDRLRRVWIFGVPLLLYTVWWLWALQFDQGRTSASNLSVVPSFFADSLNVITGALTGTNDLWARLHHTSTPEAAAMGRPGWILAAAIVAALIWTIARGRATRSLYASLGVLGTYWLAAALATNIFFGEATAVRYVLPGSIGVLLVLTDLARGRRFGRWAAIAVSLAAMLSLSINALLLTKAAADYREEYSPKSRAQYAGIELAAGISPGAGAAPGGTVPPRIKPGLGNFSDGYLVAVTRYGSPAWTLPELRAKPPDVRREADVLEIAGLGLQLEPSSPPAARSECQGPSAGPIALPAGGARLRLLGADRTLLTLNHLGPPPGTGVGTIEAREWTALQVPPDVLANPWQLSSESGEPLVVCPMR